MEASPRQRQVREALRVRERQVEERLKAFERFEEKGFTPVEHQYARAVVAAMKHMAAGDPQWRRYAPTITRIIAEITPDSNLTPPGIYPALERMDKLGWIKTGSGSHFWWQAPWLP